MKTTKLTYKSPLFGSVYCDALQDIDTRRVDISSEGVCKMYDRFSSMEKFLEDNTEDLSDFVPQELEGFVVKAVFGQVREEDGQMFLLTEIYVRKQPTDLQYKQIEDWISGQLSDGWGEGVEQREVACERMHYSTLLFDSDLCDFEEYEEDDTASYYIHPWASKDWYLQLDDIVEADLDIQEQDDKEVILEEIHTKLTELLEKLNEIM